MYLVCSLVHVISGVIMTFYAPLPKTAYLVSKLLRFRLSPEQCMPCALWPLLIGVGTLGSAREGTRCRACIMNEIAQRQENHIF